MQKEKELIVLTHSYPFGHGESFFETEIIYLSRKFNRIIVIPVSSRGGSMREVPSNVSVLHTHKLNYWYCLWLIFTHPFISVKFLIFEIFESKTLLLRKLKSLRYYLGHLIRAFWIYSHIPKDTEKNVYRVYYTYWLGVGASALSVMKEKGECNKFISRIHGIDLYSERHKNRIVLFQYLNVSYAERVISVSVAGADYMRTRYAPLNDKFHVSYLGVLDFGIKKDRGSEKVFSVVSCSNLIPLKRVELIIDSLSKVRDDIIWYHLGDGPERPFVQQQCLSLPANIRPVFLGQLSSSEVIKFYQTTSLDVFIHLSASEGLPVSMMEAISFGIPLLATDVGGVSEVCNRNTGVLLSPSPTPETVADALNYLIRNKGRSLGISAREFWRSYFNAETNYNNFIEKHLK